MNHQLPAGYFTVGGASIHVAKLRQYTTDVRRFMRFYPFVEQLEQHEPRSDSWRAAIANLSIDERRRIQVTMKEAGRLLHALADDLEKEQ